MASPPKPMKKIQKRSATANAKVSAAEGKPNNSEMTKSESSRLRILDAAANILWSNGYDGTTLAKIAKRAKLRISTLYYYFESRDDLIREVLLIGVLHLKEHVVEAVSQVAPGALPIDRLCCAVEAHARCILEISDYTGATLRNGNQVPEVVRREVAKEWVDYGHFWQRLIDDAAGGDDYASTSERRVLKLLIIGSLNWTLEWSRPGRTSVDEIVRIALLMTRRTLEGSASETRKKK